jgi:hypothetical protein
MNTLKTFLHHGRIALRLLTIAVAIGTLSCSNHSESKADSKKSSPSVSFRKISGGVINSADSKPLGGLIITYTDPVKNKSVGTLTDGEGKFVLDSVPDIVKKITVVNVALNKSKEVEISQEDNIVVKMD